MSSDLIQLGDEALKLVGAGWTAQKLLGPTLDYFGSSIEGVVAKRVENLSRILRKAATKLGDPDRLPDEAGINPRVMRAVVDEGTYFDDELAAEYFGGVLASDRHTAVSDDSAAIWSQMLSRMSSRDIRTHYVLYRAAQLALRDSNINFGSSPPGGGESRVYISFPTYGAAMGLRSPSELNAKQWNLWAESMYGLEQEMLVEERSHGGWSLASGDRLKEDYPKILQSGAIFRPAFRGIRLFLMAHGINHDNTAFTGDLTEFVLEQEIPIAGSFCSVDKLTSMG